MMISAFTEGKGQAEYAYNGFMKRIRKLETLVNPGKENGIPLDPMREIRYTLDMTLPYNNLLATEGASNQKFAWGNGLISASGEDNFYYLQDHLGSPIRLMGENDIGTPLAYDEFGVPLAECTQSAQSKHNPFGFTGYQMDDVSRLDYAQARYYDSACSRMLSEDAFPGNQRNPLTLNRYAYCRNNPMVLIDPSGYFWNEIWEGMQAGVNTTIRNLDNFMQSLGMDTALVGGILLGMTPDENGIYHSSTNGWQQIAGFNDFYDVVFDLATSMDKEKFKFEVDGREYVFWAWKGDYLNLGAGAELGIYSNESGILGMIDVTSPIPGHWLVDTSQALPMDMMLRDRNGNLIASYDPSDPQWWITSFNPAYQFADANDLTSVSVVDFTGREEMYHALERSLNPQDPSFWFFDHTTHQAILIFPMKLCEE